RSLERSLERVVSPSIAWQSADRVGEAVASALGSAADRFRHGADVVTDEAAKFGSEATKLGNTALQRLAEEVARRPLSALILAVGVGFLVGAGRRRSMRRAPPTL